MEASRHDAWRAADSYLRYMGRWSRRISPIFLDWLGQPKGLRWADIGCGTGALSEAVIDRSAPRSVVGIDASEDFVAFAANHVEDQRVAFMVGDAQALSLTSHSVDVATSGLMLNFVPDQRKALDEMRRIVTPGGVVAFYVWDYPGGGLEFLDIFWKVAEALDPAAGALAESRRFPGCKPKALTDLALSAGLTEPTTAAIETVTVFTDFDDFWRPFTLGAGPAPGYCVSLSSDAGERLRSALSETLPREPDGSIRLGARAWAVRSTSPPGATS